MEMPSIPVEEDKEEGRSGSEREGGREVGRAEQN